MEVEVRHAPMIGYAIFVKGQAEPVAFYESEEQAQAVAAAMRRADIGEGRGIGKNPAAGGDDGSD